MMKKLRELFFIMCLCLNFFQLRATHIVGGDIAVRWLSGNDFEITLNFFRDCGPNSYTFDHDVEYGVYDKVTNVMQQSFIMPRLSRHILPLGDTCFTPPNLCVEHGIYMDTIIIPDNPNGYYIAWQRCCRNHVILNIQNPGAAGMVFYTEIADPALHNSSPVFGSYPNAYMCLNQTNIKYFTCSDADGDSLRYSLVTPLNGNATQNNTGSYDSSDVVLTHGPFSDILWQPPLYSASNMIGGTSPMSIDPQTGTLTAQPPYTGVFVFAVKVEEFRNGIKIGEVRRDIQYQVLACLSFTAPVFSSPVTTTITDLTSDTSFSVIAGDVLSFDAIVTSADVNDSVYLYGASELFATPFGMSHSFHNDSAQGSVQQNFFLQTTCDAIREAPYRVTLNGVKHTCYGLLTTSINVDIYVRSLTDGSMDSLVPNVFTPGNDGFNDFFKINATPDYCFDKFNLHIYNRWGKLMYETTDFLFQWDGTNQSGSKLSEGVYYYTLEASFKQTLFTKRGFIHLLR